MVFQHRIVVRSPRAPTSRSRSRKPRSYSRLAAADPDAVARVRAILPDKARIVLADAQFVLARASMVSTIGTRSESASRNNGSWRVHRTSRCTTP